MGSGKCKNCCQCLLWILALVIVLLVIALILVATIFKPKRPITTLNYVALRDFNVSFDADRMKVDLNLSLVASISVKNPNIFGLKYRDSSAFMDYRGEVVGQASIPAGQISARQTSRVYVTLTVLADRLLANLQAVVSDLRSGNLPLSTRTRISGKVTVLFVKVDVVSEASCHLNISVTSQSISNSDCTHDTRLS